MASTEPVQITFEFARTTKPAEEFAFQFVPTDYVLRIYVLRSGGAVQGGAFQGVKVAWSDALLADLTALGQPRCPPETVQRVGDQLRAVMEPGGWPAIAQTVEQAVADKGPVTLTIRSGAAELYALPWELLTLRGSGQHLGELENVLVRYEWPDTQTANEERGKVAGEGRILFAWSAAGGAVPAAEHLASIQKCAEAGHVAFDPERDVLAHVSTKHLADALDAAAAAGAPVAALHLLCHGAEKGDTFGLVWDGDGGEVELVDPAALRRLFAPHAGQVRLIVLSACESANPGAMGNHLGSVAQTLHRAGVQAVVASRFPLSVEGSVSLVDAFYGELLGGPSSVERAVLAARRVLAQDPGHLDWASVQIYAREADGGDTRPLVFRPYRGLLAFQSNDSRFFLGRDAEKKTLAARVRGALDGRHPRFQAVVGASGCGKSSLVLAGLCPDLQQRGETWDVAVLRPAVPGGLLRGLVQAVRAAGRAAPSADGDAAPTAQAAIDEIRRRRAERPDRALLVVVDQLEELFSLGYAATEREAFVQALWGLGSEAALRTVVLVTMRVDSLGQCAELMVDDSGQSVHLGTVMNDQEHALFVTQVASAELRAVIEGPAARVGLAFQPGLVDSILSDVGEAGGVLPLLEYALDELWKNRKGTRLTEETYRAMGGFKGALARTADAVLDAMTPAEQLHARRLLVRMVNPAEAGGLDGLRRAWTDTLRPEAAADAAAFDSALGKLVQSRLLVVGDEEPGDPRAGAWAEIADQALIRTWDRLRGWIAEDREMLQQLTALDRSSQEWRAHRATPQANEYVLQGSRLAAAIEFRGKHTGELGSAIDDFIVASEAAAASGATTERRRARKVFLYSAIATLGVFILLIIVLGETDTLEGVGDKLLWLFED